MSYAEYSMDMEIRLIPMPMPQMFFGVSQVFNFCEFWE